VVAIARLRFAASLRERQYIAARLAGNHAFFFRKADVRHAICKICSGFERFEMTNVISRAQRARWMTKT
jgi:hypothetical protein